MSKAILAELENFLHTKPRELTVVAMPDFFLDRLVSLRLGLTTFCDNLVRVAGRKGGSIDNTAQRESNGGNAMNTASALAALSASVVPIVCTNKLGLQLMKTHLRSGNVDLSHVKLFDNMSITTALEFKAGRKKVNVMLRDVGALAQFGMQHLNRDDLDVVDDADYVCVFNWAGTKSFGTELAKGVFHHTKTCGKGKTYFDTADPTPNQSQIPKLVKSVLKSDDLDILSVNENEAAHYASQISKQVRLDLPFDELAKKSAKILSAHVTARVDFHATSFSTTFTRKGEITVPAFKVPIQRTTGAGDAWNAGNIIGDSNRLSDGCRLALANAVAAYYISSPNGAHPTLKQLAGFIARIRRP